MTESYKNIALLEYLKNQKKYFSSALNKDKLDKVETFKTKVQLIQNNLLLKESYAFFDGRRLLNLSETNNLNEVFSKIERGLSLYIEDFIALIPYLSNVIEIKNLFKDTENVSVPNLLNEVLDIISFPNLLSKYRESFTEDGTVNDCASVQLREIRSEIRKTTKSIDDTFFSLKKRYKDYLSDENPYREGVETLAVKSNFISKVSGITLQSSNTGRTLFVLPKEIMDLRNKLEGLYEEESDEIARILDTFSKELFRNYTQLYKEYQIYNFIDSLYGRTNFGKDNDYVVPEISDDTLELNGLVHPLIDRAVCVKNSVSLSKKDKYFMVLSGPNAGGKSVLFRSIAFSFYLNMIGFPINCTKESKITFASDIFLILGDDESVEANLSRFSGHLVNLNEIVSKADENSLIIVDEICAGTDPREGESLGIAFIKDFLSKNAFSFVSTHYEAIKKFAKVEDKIVTATMEFDASKLSPTFRLLVGSIGNSYAIECARKVGVADSIIKEAKSNMKKYSSMSDRLETILNKELMKTKSLNEKLKEKDKQYEELMARREKALTATKEIEANIRKQADEKIERIVSQKEEELDALFERYKDKIPFKVFAEIKGQLHSFETVSAKKQNNQPQKQTLSKTENKKIEHEIVVGDFVIYEGVNKCKVLAINNGKYRLSVNGLVITTTKDNIVYDAKNSVKVVKNASQLSSVDTAILNSDFRLELNVIGLNSEDAVKEVATYLSNAVVKHVKQVRIIHGMGNFILRNAIHKYLDKQDYVKSYRAGGETEGGFGATVVYLA